MKKVFSLCLAALLVLSMMPVNAFAAETENEALKELEETIENNARAEIKDAEGNVVETLKVDVQVQQISTSSRSADGVEYVITCTARSTNNDPYTDDDSQDGYVGVLTMICKDVFGTENILISVSGNFSGDETDTDQRRVIYGSYNTADLPISQIEKENVGLSFMYTPVDYTGFTFRAWSYARIVETDNWLEMHVTTDGV